MSDLKRANEFYLTMLAAARREGEEAMREKAAQLMDNLQKPAGVWVPFAGDAIRALPLTPEADEREGGRGNSGQGTC